MKHPKISKTHEQVVMCLFLGAGLLLLFTNFSISKSPVKSSSNDEITLSSDFEKQRGVHVFGQLDSLSFEPISETNFDWITFVPYAGMTDHTSSTIRYFRGDSTRLARRDSMWYSHIQLAKEAGMKVFIKPHIWIRSPEDGKWRSDIFPNDDDEWEIWKEHYRKFIFHYARMAQETNAEMYCIGTELTRLSTEKPDFWVTLIKEVRAIYNGEITYAANWYKEYEKIKFWDQLDYIGIQAYFPLVNDENPDIPSIIQGWKKHISDIESMQEKYNRKILFTEMGYKSTADAAIKPWEWMEYTEENEKSISLATQSNCYQAFFDAVWNKPWFAGVHIWQWRSNYSESGGEDNLDFTPQRKPAEKTIAKGFSRN